MNTQLNLFETMYSSDVEKFIEYHQKYPTVYKRFKQLAFDAKKIGHKHFSARGLFQVMRFKMDGNIKDDGFKYNNNYTPMYVRMLEKECPEFIDFFEKRKSKSDESIQLISINN